MEAYRICLVKYAGELAASGNSGCWNLRGQLVIYAAGSRALTCLENVVHRSGEGLNSYFQVARIDVPDALPIERLTLAQMPADWQLARHYARCSPRGPLGISVRRRPFYGCRPSLSPMSTTTCSIPATWILRGYASRAKRILLLTRGLSRMINSKKGHQL